MEDTIAASQVLTHVDVNVADGCICWVSNRLVIPAVHNHCKH